MLSKKETFFEKNENSLHVCASHLDWNTMEIIDYFKTTNHMPCNNVEVLSTMRWKYFLFHMKYIITVVMNWLF